jgi:hypothetical protein
MSYEVNSNIIRDGLIFHIDAANGKCYPKSGLNVNDLSVTKSIGTLEDGARYNTDNLGNFDFDGIDDYIDCTNNSAFDLDYGDSFSILTWVKFSDLTGFGFLVSKWLTTVVSPLDARAYFTGTNGNKFTFRMFNSGGATQGILVDSNVSLITGKWYHLVATYDGSNANGVNLYIDTEISNNILRSNPVGTVLNTEPLQIGGQYTFFTGGQIANVKIYNREITQDEVLYNYNALKYRFV